MFFNKLNTTITNFSQKPSFDSGWRVDNPDAPRLLFTPQGDKLGIYPAPQSKDSSGGRAEGDIGFQFGIYKFADLDRDTNIGDLALVKVGKHKRTDTQAFGPYGDSHQPQTHTYVDIVLTGKFIFLHSRRGKFRCGIVGPGFMLKIDTGDHLTWVALTENAKFLDLVSPTFTGNDITTPWNEDGSKNERFPAPPDQFVETLENLKDDGILIS